MDDRLSVCLVGPLDEAVLAAQPPVLPRSISNGVASAYCRKLPLHRKVVTRTQRLTHKPWTRCLAWRPMATRSGTYGVDPSLGRGLATSRSNLHVCAIVLGRPTGGASSNTTSALNTWRVFSAAGCAEVVASAKGWTHRERLARPR